MRQRPSISVVMPVRNGAPYLAEAIGSIQRQRRSDWELIVVENDSSDNSVDIVARLAADDRRIMLIGGLPRGRAHAANVGVEHAHGTHIALMDQDDLASPDRFTVQLEWMERTGVEICGSWVRSFGDRDGLMWFPETHESIRRELVFRCALMQPSVLLKAEILKRNRYDETVAFDDHELWVRLHEHHRMGNVPAVLLRYRCHPDQTSRARHAEFTADIRRLRAPQVRRLFADAESVDIEAVDRVGDRLPFPTVPALEHAGSWLLRLADVPDRLLRARMRERWRVACLASAELGPDVYATYRRLALAFGDGGETEDRALQVACLDRIPAAPGAGPAGRGTAG